MESFIILVIVALVVLAIIWTRYKNTQQKEEERRAYSLAITEAKQALVTGDGLASLPVLSASEHSYRPVSKEDLFAVQNGVTRLEVKSTGRYRAGGHSVSIPIMKGVRYRVSSGSIQTEKTWQATARGRFLATDKAIAFEGSDKNERITWTQVANIELLSDGFVIAKRTGPARTYQVDSPDAKFAAVVELMLARIA